MHIGQTELVIASPEESNINSIEDVTSDMVIATEFPVKKKYLNKHGLDLKIVKLSGSTEIAPFIGVADLISDLSSTNSLQMKKVIKIKRI